jgi:transposase
VATDVFGVSGTAMLRALAEGDMAPEAMAELAKGRLRTKLEPLVKALQGRVSEHHRFLLRLHLRRLDEIERDLAELETRIAERMRPYRRQVGLLKRIPGVDEIGAAEILAETGIDMTVFGNARRLAAWAGVCPGNHESAGRSRKTSTRKGNPHLKAALFRAATCAAKAKGTYYKEKYYRLKARLGAKRAAMAIAHKILLAVFHILAGDTEFRELGAAHLDQQNKHRVTKGLVRRLDALGYEVILRPKLAA